MVFQLLYQAYTQLYHKVVLDKVDLPHTWTKAGVLKSQTVLIQLMVVKKPFWRNKVLNNFTSSRKCKHQYVQLAEHSQHSIYFFFLFQ